MVWLEVPITACFRGVESLLSRSAAALFVSGPIKPSEPNKIRELIQPRPSCQLYDLVLDLDWEGVLHHLRDHREDAAYHDGDTWETPLYVALQYQPPVEIVRELLEACPDQANEVSRRHRDLPLLIACRCQASLDVLEELLLYTKVVQQRTKYGSTVLTALWEGRRIVDTAFWQKVRLVLIAMATQQQQELCAYAAEQKGNRQKHSSINTSKGEEELLIVHAVVSLGSQGCPIEILEYCLRQYAHQVLIKDDQNCLPLHVALGEGTREMVDSCNTAQKMRSRRRRLCTKYQTGLTVLTMLLHIYPEAALVPVSKSTSGHESEGDAINGELPLHRALRRGYTWYEGVEELLQAAPATLGAADPTTGLFPFQLAAAILDGTPHNSKDLSTIFLLVRADPSVFINAIDMQPVCDELQTHSKKHQRNRRGSQQIWSLAAAAAAAAVATSMFILAHINGAII